MTNAREYPIQLALAAALKAHEANEGFIGSRDYSQKPKNSRLMLDYLEKDVDLSQFEDQARNIVSYCQTKMLELISGNLTPYWQGILDAVNQPTIGNTDFKHIGLLASVPQAYFRSVARDTATEKREQAAVTSKHFGTVGEKLDLTVQVISHIYSVKYGRHFFTGVTSEGNLVNFPYNHELAVGSTVNMSARVRKHTESNTTMLNYVKIKVDKTA